MSEAIPSYWTQVQERVAKDTNWSVEALRSKAGAEIEHAENHRPYCVLLEYASENLAAVAKLEEKFQGMVRINDANLLAYNNCAMENKSLRDEIQSDRALQVACLEVINYLLDELERMQAPVSEEVNNHTIEVPPTGEDCFGYYL